MNAPADLDADLEERLRSGLQAAADALPPEPDTRPRSADVPLLHPQQAVPPRRWAIRVAAAAASVAVVAGVAVVVTRGGDGDKVSNVSTESSDTTTTTAAGTEPGRVTNGQVPGQAIAQGMSLRQFGADGTETGTLDLTHLDGVTMTAIVGSAASDLDGGWVICGLVDMTEDQKREHHQHRFEEYEQLQAELTDEAPAAGPTTTIPDGHVVIPTPPLSPEYNPDDYVGNQESMVWVPADGPPQLLYVPYSTCEPGGTQVVDSADGPMAINGNVSMTSAGGGQFDGTVLATGEQRRLPSPQGLPTLVLRMWSVNSERLIAYVQGEGYEMWDLTTGQPVTMAALDPGPPDQVSLAPDGKTVAVVMGGFLEPRDVVVYDVATGEERFRRRLGAEGEGYELSWDGQTLAVSHWAQGEGDMRVFDTTTGEERSIDAWGVVL